MNWKKNKKNIDNLSVSLTDIQQGECKDKVPSNLLESFGMESVKVSIEQKVKRADIYFGVVMEEVKNLKLSDESSGIKGANNELRGRIRNFFSGKGK